MKRENDQFFIAEDDEHATVVYFDGHEAYEAFIEEYGVEPLRILDVTQGYGKAWIVWERLL
jgi:hypothetical protein|tara:strand:- start:114 stop:296 length:183 start_codon:yes stop_codon:yes gene_type:complete